MEPLIQLLHLRNNNNEINQLILGKLSTDVINEWLSHMIGLIIGFYQQNQQINTQMNTKSINIYTINQLFDYNINHLTINNENNNQLSETNSIPMGICFSKLKLLGRSNSHIVFFGNKTLAKEFQNYVFNSMNISLINESNELNGESIPIRKRLLKVTIILRSNFYLRKINNLYEIIQMLLKTKLINKKWLFLHIIRLENISFQKQIEIFHQTDIAISIHGAAIINGIFMKQNSVFIDIFNGNYLEYFFKIPLKEMNIELLVLPISNHSLQVTSCPLGMPLSCVSNNMIEGIDTKCAATIRGCSLNVDIDRLHIVFMEAYMYVLANKWLHT